jgi:hypothetical protein
MKWRNGSQASGVSILAAINGGVIIVAYHQRKQ